MNALDVIQTTPRAERACVLIGWKPWPFGNSGLLGHADLHFSGWVIHRVPVFRKGTGLSVGAPSGPEIDSEGRVRLRDGKKQYWPVITFANGAAKDRWSRTILDALAAGGIAS
jgi:hypothetical protein